MEILRDLLGSLPGIALIIFITALLVLGVYDLVQRRHAIRRNFPIIGGLRYLLETVGPELRQYLFSDDQGDRPIPRRTRAWIYASSKDQRASVPFGTQLDLDKPGTLFIRHSANPIIRDSLTPQLERVIVGERTGRPYEAHIFNISGMSFGSIGRNAVRALSMGAAEVGCFLNTGEGGISAHHLAGGADLCWQIGTGKFGCRTPEGDFDPERFGENAALPQVKLIEVKLSQGAKPGQGGLLPAAKVTPEIARARGVPVGEDCISPARHREWTDARGMIEWIAGLRRLTDKPIGIKFALGREEYLDELCDAMHRSGEYLDFITVDGAEGGTGAAPLGFTDYLAWPAHDAIMLTDNALRRHGLRDKIRLIAAGRIFTGAQSAIALALGADMVNSARGFMLSIGCIHALRCNTNRCPAGVTTHNWWLQRGLIPEEKAPRVANYHKAVMEEIQMILHACGYTSAKQLRRSDVMRVVSWNKAVPMDQLVPYATPLDGVPPLREEV